MILWLIIIFHVFHFATTHIYFLQFSADKKKLDLAEKFKELKKSGKVEKYMQKKRKKNASKEKKKLPNLT